MNCVELHARHLPELLCLVISRALYRNGNPELMASLRMKQKPGVQWQHSSVLQQVFLVPRAPCSFLDTGRECKQALLKSRTGQSTRRMTQSTPLEQLVAETQKQKATANSSNTIHYLPPRIKITIFIIFSLRNLGLQVGTSCCRSTVPSRRQCANVTC